MDFILTSANWTKMDNETTINIDLTKSTVSLENWTLICSLSFPKIYTLKKKNLLH